jgi:hypothetical protein
MLAVPLRGGTPTQLCIGCFADWAPDGKWIYISVGEGQTLSAFTYLAVPSGSAQAPPQGVPAMLQAAASGTLTSGTRLIQVQSFQIGFGTDPSVFAFAKRDVQRNLFRIPLH